MSPPPPPLFSIPFEAVARLRASLPPGRFVAKSRSCLDRRSFLDLVSKKSKTIEKISVWRAQRERDQERGRDGRGETDLEGDREEEGGKGRRKGKRYRER